jgi:hypothetical protein
MGQQYHEVTRRQVDRVLMRERLKGIFKVNGGTAEDLDDDTDDNTDDTDDDAYTAALNFLLHTADGTSVLRRVFGSGGVTSVGDLEALARLAAHVLRNTASGDADGRDPYQPWTANDADADTDDDEQINDDAERVAATKSFPMTPREIVLRRLVKSCGGVQTLCKQIVDQGESDVSEHELTGLLIEDARARQPVHMSGRSDAQVFTDMVTRQDATGEAIRRALNVTKRFISY